MIRSLVAIMVCLCFSVFLSSCNKPKTIPNDKLQTILKEIYVANAYMANNYGGRDTTDVYSPILEKHGYTVDDLKYTITGFSRRKSARLADVIENTIREMEVDYNLIAAGVVKLDTIDARAGERFSKVVFFEDSLRIRRVSDTSKLRITISPIEAGRYKISYVYKLDTTDHNGSIRGMHNYLDSTGRQLNYDSHWFTSGERRTYSANLDVRPNAKKLVLTLGNYSKNMKTPHLDVDSIMVKHYLPKEVALDSINKLLVDYKLLIDGKEWSNSQKDSVTLHTNPPRLAAGDSGDGK